MKAYFGLKLAGYTADHPALQRARKKILEMGGVTEVNTFTKIYLCFFGQYDYDAVPAIPPEIVLFPNWFWFNIYEISSWSRAILVPLSICYAKKPFKKIPREMGVEELFVGGMRKSRMHLHWAKKLVSWRNFFLVLDRMTHWLERVHVRPLRSIALKSAEKWMLERFEMSDGLGAIYPSMMNAIIALRCLGYSLDDPQVIRAMDEFEKLGIEEEDTFRMQPCMSPVWDTAYALFALGEAGVPANDPRMVKCADWILQKQVRNLGDWKVKNKKGQPGGWYFEFNNEFYPDVDDSAMVCLALSRVEHPNGRYQRESVQRAIDWIFSMQCKNGGWASFDKDNDKMVFQYIPFADHNAMLDPATVDITGRILEMLATYGYDKNHPAVKRAIRVRPQRAGAGWKLVRTLGRELYLRHGAGAARAGSDRHGSARADASSRRRSGCAWCRMPMAAGARRLVRTTIRPCAEQGESTPSQTAWAILGLLAAGDTRSDSVARGIAYLLRTQKKDGSWDEAFYTGTGFPRVFYLKYHLYRQYFPLLALTTYAKVMEKNGN